MKKFLTLQVLVGIGVGIFLGLVLMGLVVQYLITKASSNESTNGVPLGGTIERIREGMATIDAEKKATSVYGKVVSIGNGTLVLKVQRSQEAVDYTFTFNDQTKIVSLAQDAASTEVPLSSDAIEVGAGLNVFTDEPIGSVENQHAVKIIQI